MIRARHELVPLADRGAWEAALEDLPHGHAHTWGFCRAAQLTSGAPTYLYSYERNGSRAVCPLAERMMLDESDVFTPYGFGGFALRGPCERLPNDWAEFARSRGWVCGYLALNPLFCDAAGFATSDVRIQNHLYVMDLRPPAGELFRRLSENRRRQLRDWPAAAAGLEHDRPKLADFLVAHYQDFFERRGAGSATRFNPETMKAISELDDVIMVGAGAGELKAAAVFGHTRHGGDYLFNVSLSGGEGHSVRLLWSGVEQLRALGVPSLNLGGGIREGDDLAEFKRRFGAAELPLASLRQVYRADVYAALCRQAGAAAGHRSDYFPAYRG